MSKTWDASRVTAALNAIKDNGYSVKQMTRISGANRSTIYRWMSGSGDGQPDYALVTSLARGVWPRYPDLARALVEASGYAWAEPTEPPAEPLIDPDVLTALERAYKGEPEKLAEAVQAIEAVNAGGPGGTGPSRRESAS